MATRTKSIVTFTLNQAIVDFKDNVNKIPTEYKLKFKKIFQ